MSTTTYELHDLIACAIREVELRKNVYPKFIAQGRMTKEKAAWEIGAMKAIAEKLKNWPPEGGEK
jgi:hypothetical protein